MTRTRCALVYALALALATTPAPAAAGSFRRAYAFVDPCGSSALRVLNDRRRTAGLEPLDWSADAARRALGLARACRYAFQDAPEATFGLVVRASARGSSAAGDACERAAGFWLRRSALGGAFFAEDGYVAAGCAATPRCVACAFVTSTP